MANDPLPKNVGNSLALRQSLHKQLDKLLDCRWAIEQNHRLKQIEPDDLPRSCRTLFQAAARFSDNCVGANIRQYALSDEEWTTEDLRVAIGKKLMLVAPLFDGRRWQRSDNPLDVMSDEIIDEISAIRLGDHARLLKQGARQSGYPKNWYRLTRMKARALAWNLLLKQDADQFVASDKEKLPKWMRTAAGRQRRISKAFGAEWDAIRKWIRAVKRLADSGDVAQYLQREKQATSIARQLGVTLEKDGNRYRDELRRSKSP